jgi:colanic acid/amylovoran biosynthesis glycosyltransferase
MGPKLEEASFVAAVTRYGRDHLLRAGYPEAASARIEVVRCGVLPEFHTPAPHPPGDPPFVLAVSRLVDLKGFHHLVAAIGILRDKGIAVRCTIVGDGPEESRLNALVRSLRLEDRVTLTGKRLQAELKTMFREADLFALPCCRSRVPGREIEHDGLPVVLIEAMAMGLPVVSTRLSGIPELVRHEATGLLVEPDDQQGLADALERLLRDRDLAMRLAKAGRLAVIEEFNSESSAAALLELFSAPATGRERALDGRPADEEVPS